MSEPVSDFIKTALIIIVFIGAAFVATDALFGTGPTETLCNLPIIKQFC